MREDRFYDAIGIANGKIQCLENTVRQQEAQIKDLKDTVDMLVRIMRYSYWGEDFVYYDDRPGAKAWE